MQQTARDNRIQFREAANSVENHFYMDDYLESSPTVEEATKKAHDLVEMLAKGGFQTNQVCQQCSKIGQQRRPEFSTRRID